MGDIFDKVSAAPTGDIFDRVASQPQKPPPLSRAQADQQIQAAGTLGMGKWQPPTAGPSFAQSYFVDPQAPEVGGNIFSANRNFTAPHQGMVDIRDVAAARKNIQTQINTPGPNVLRGDEEGDSTGGLTISALQHMPEMYGDIGADLGEKTIRFAAKNFQDDSQATPAEIGIARGAGRFVASNVTDPTNLALMSLAPEGKVAQTLMSGAFAAQGLSGSYEQAKQLHEVWNDPNVDAQTKAELATGLVANTTLAGLAGFHGIHSHFSAEGRVAPSGDSSAPLDKATAATASAVDALPKTGGGFSGLDEKVAPSPAKDIFDSITLDDRRSASRGDDRRQDLDTRKKVAEMSPEEKAQALLTSEKTGLPNYRAFQESADTSSQTHPFVGYADIDDFKSWNDKLGHARVDTEVLPAVGTAMQWATAQEGGKVQAFHRSGDEFVFRANDPDAISRVVQRVNEQAKNVGLGFSHGVGDSEASAELAAASDKVTRKALGLRVGIRDNNLAEKVDNTPDSGTIRTNPESTKAPMSIQPDTPRAETIPISAKERSIQAAKARFTPERLEEIKQEGAAEQEDRTLNSFVNYSKVKSQLSEIEDQIDRAKNAATKGLSYGAKTPDGLSRMEQKAEALRNRATDLFSTHAKGLTPEETEGLVRGIEEPVYKQIGKAVQLHQLITDDVEAKRLKNILNEDVTPSGLSVDSQKYLAKYFPNEDIKTRLTRGDKGQRTRIYDKLGYEESETPNLKVLRYLPDLEKAKASEAKTQESLQSETDPEARTGLQAQLQKQQEVVRRFQDIHDKVRGARKFASEMAEAETDPKRKAFYEKMNERAGSKSEASAAAQDRLTRLRTVLDTEKDPAKKVMIQAGIDKLEREAAAKSLMAATPEESSVRNEDYKYQPILYKAKIKGEPRGVLSKFVDRAIPGAIKEISARNLKAILGDTTYNHTLDRLRPHEKQALNELAPAEAKSASWYSTDAGREYMRLKQEFVRNRVEEVRDKLVRQIQNNMKLVSTLKEARGIPKDHLTPLETSVHEMLEAFRNKEAPSSKPTLNKLLTSGGGFSGLDEKTSGVRQTPEASKVVSSGDPILQLQGTVDNLRSGKPVDPQLMQKLKDIGVVKEGMGNGAIADTLQKYVNRQKGVEKAKATKAAAATNPQPPKPPQMPEASQAEQVSTLTPAEASSRDRAKGLEKEISTLDPQAKQVFQKLADAAREIGTNRADKYSLYAEGLKVYRDGLAKDDPWAMMNAAKAIRRPEERGTVGPSRRNLSPDEIKESYRVYSHVMLKRYEGMTDLAQARFRDKINDGVLQKAVMESGDQNVKDRFLKLLDKVGTNDPVQALGNAIINGQKITPREAAEGLMRNRLGEMKLDKIRLRKTVEDAAARWDKAHIADSVDFIDAIEKGDLSKFSPEDQAIGKSLRDLLDNRRTKLQNLGKDYLKTYIEDYFPHLWSNVGKARDMAKGLLSRRPLAGDSGFLKSREYDTFKEGLASGLQPLTWNPVKMALTRMEQIDKFLAAHKMADDFKQEGLAKYIRVGGDVPEGWTEMQDKIFRAEKLDTKTGALMTFGKWYAPDEVAKAFNNHLSPGLTGNTAYNIVRKAGNAVNQANLVGGVFHLIESGFNTTVSDLALSLKAGSEGQFKIAAKSLARMPVSVVDAYFNSGRKMMAEAMSPGKYAEYARSVDYMKRAGGTLQIDPAYLNQSVERFKTNLKTALDSDSLTKNRLNAGRKLPINALGAILEKANWAVMEHFVPRMKAATFHRMAQEIYAKMGDTPNEHLLNKEVDDAWDSVDNRLGEMVYDNLFFNRTAKDIALVTFRSTGWNLGTAREIGGGAMDVGSRLKRNLQGESINMMSHRTAYTIALIGSVMGIGATMTYLATGKGPQSGTDYFYPPDGTTGPDGKPNRQYLKTYIHDVNSLLQHPLSTLAHKASPLWSQAFDTLWANADFYGREIRHPGDSPLEQTKSVGNYLLQSSMPFAYQNYKEEDRRDSSRTSKIEATLGILPAPKWAGQSKAEALAYDLSIRNMPQNQDKDTFDRIQRMDTLRNKYAHGNASVEDVINSVTNKSIRYQDARTILAESNMSPLERHIAKLTPKDALQVWDAATPEERGKIYPELIKKYRGISDYEPDEQSKLQTRFQSVLETMRNIQATK